VGGKIRIMGAKGRMEPSIFGTRKDKNASSFLFLSRQKGVCSTTGRKSCEYVYLEEEESIYEVYRGAREKVERRVKACYSLGKSIRPSMVMKKRPVVMKMPSVVIRPDGPIISINR